MTSSTSRARQGLRSLDVHYCPFCGGAAPESERASLFATVTPKEVARLRKLARGLTTVSAVIEKLGEPDHDMAEGLTIRTAATENEPSKIETCRTLTYGGLSRPRTSTSPTTARTAAG